MLPYPSNLNFISLIVDACLLEVYLFHLYFFYHLLVVFWLRLQRLILEIFMMHNLLSFILTSRRSCRYKLFWSLVYGLWMDFLFYKGLLLFSYYYFHNLITLLICLSVYWLWYAWGLDHTSTRYKYPRGLCKWFNWRTGIFSDIDKYLFLVRNLFVFHTKTYN